MLWQGPPPQGRAEHHRRLGVSMHLWISRVVLSSVRGDIPGDSNIIGNCIPYHYFTFQFRKRVRLQMQTQELCCAKCQGPCPLIGWD